MMTSDESNETAKPLKEYEDVSGIKNEVGMGIDDTIAKSGGHGAREGERDLLWRKRLNTLFLGLGFISLGITYSLAGPAFLDLLHLVQVNIERGAIIFTVASVGYLTGSLVCGFAFDKVNHDLLLFVATFGTGLFVIFSPQIPILAVVTTSEGMSAVCAGVLDTALNTNCMLIWGVEAGPYMQAVHFLFAIGGLLAPIIAEPFLMEKFNTSVSTIVANNSTLINNSSDGTRDYQFDSTANSTVNKQPETQVKFAFLICGLLAVITSFTFMYIYFVNKRHNKWNQNLQDEPKKEEVKLALTSKIVYLVLLALFFLVYTCIEDTFMNFLAAFVVEYSGWSASDGARLMSVYWGSYAGARLLSVLISKIISPWKMLLLDFIFLLTTFILLCFLVHITAVLWISSALVGLSIASVFPTAFTWAQTDIIKVDARVASLFIISGGVGAVVNPLLIGYLFEHSTPMWFVWLLLGECVLVILIFFIITILINVRYGRTFTDKRSGIVLNGDVKETEILC